MNAGHRYFCALLAMVTVSNACLAQEARQPHVSLEKTLSTFVHSSAPPRPEGLARALGLSIGKATVSSREHSENAVSLVYRVGANPWGITEMRWHLAASKDGQHQAYGDLTLQLDKTFCLRPSDFAHDVDLALDRRPIAIPDGGGTHDVDTYQSPRHQPSQLRVEADTLKGCAKAVALVRAYGHENTGPSMASLIPNTLATRFPMHPPYTALAFWQRLTTLIRLHHGYVAPDELQKSLDVDMSAVTIGSNQLASRKLKAYDDWYMTLDYAVSGPEYKSSLPAVFPDGPGSSLQITIPDFTFLNKAGGVACLPLETVESDLQGDHWERDVKVGPNDALSVRRFLHGERNSIIDVWARSANHCIVMIKITGSLHS